MVDALVVSVTLIITGDQNPCFEMSQLLQSLETQVTIEQEEAFPSFGYTTSGSTTPTSSIDSSHKKGKVWMQLAPNRSRRGVEGMSANDSETESPIRAAKSRKKWKFAAALD